MGVFTRHREGLRTRARTCYAAKMIRAPTADVFSVARYVRQRLGQVDPRKLQKLVYYAQAWSLVWRQRPAFGERIEAWVDGPVSPDLWTDGIQHTGCVQSAGDLS